MPATATRPKVAKPVAVESNPTPISQQTVILHLDRGNPTFQRRMSTEAIADTTDRTYDRSMFDVSKHLLDRKVLAEIHAEDTSIRAYLTRYCTPCSLLANQMWLLSLGLVEEVDQRVQQYIVTRKLLARKLAREGLEAAKADAKLRLGSHYDEADYPTPEEFEAAFDVQVHYMSFDVPAALKTISQAMYKREASKVAGEWENVEAEIRTALRESFAGLVERMADRLGTNEEGKPNKFKNGTVEQMQDFLRTFAARDLTNDTALAKLAAKAEAVMKGVDPDALREPGDTRERVLGAMQQIEAKLTAMDVVSPAKRKFRQTGEV